MCLEFSPEDQQEYQERLAAIMPSFCAPEDQMLLNLTRYWGCPDAEGTLQELVEVGLLEKSPPGGYRQPIPDWLPATEQPGPVAELPIATLIPVPPIPTSSPAARGPVIDHPAPVQSASTSTLKPLRLSRPTIAA